MLLVAAASLARPAQQDGTPGPQIRVQTSLVSVPVVVSDSSGRQVSGLRVEDFTLRDDGLTQKIAFFAASEEPINVALLLDTSKSTVAILEKIKRAALKFLRQLRPQDRGSVVAFDYALHTLAQLTGDRTRLEDAIRAAQPGEYVGTRLRDAVVDVTEKKFKPILGRKAVVLLTDGQDYGSEAPAGKVVDSATESGTVVYTVLYRVDPEETIRKLFGIRLPRSGGGRSPAWHEREAEAAEQMRRLSEESAGRLYRVELEDLEAAFSQISQELRHQYLLAFHPERSRLDGDLHALSIQVSRPGLLVRSRGSYRLTP